MLSGAQELFGKVEVSVLGFPSLKPVLNWANVCSPNKHTSDSSTNYDRFLIELLVRWTWFGQFEEFTCSQLACNEMQASARTCGRRAADSMNPKCWLKSNQVKSVYFNHPSQGNSANYYLILGLRDKAAPPTSQQIKNSLRSEWRT